MGLARFVGFACFWACLLPFAGAMAAEQPAFLLAIPALVVFGLGFLVASHAIEILIKVKEELETIRLQGLPQEKK